jgi:hypothetical protein
MAYDFMNMFKNFFNMGWIIIDLDRKLCVALITISLIMILVGIQGQYQYLLFGILLTASSIAWMIRKDDYSVSCPGPSNKSLTKILLIAFFSVFLLSIIVYFMRIDVYIRPFSFFILISILPVCIFYEITHFKEDKYYIILIQIIIFCIFLSWSVVSLYPSLIGVDTPWHDHFVQLIINSGFIPEGYVYSNVPFFDLLIGIPQVIFNVDYKVASFIMITIGGAICNVLLIYLITKKLFNYQSALLASLCLTFFNMGIYFLAAPIPTTLATTFLLFVVYLLLLTKDRFNVSHLLLIFLFSLSIVLTHSLISLIMSILLFIAIIINLFPNKASTIGKINLSNTFPPLFTIMMISWWSYVSGQINIIQNIVNVGLRADLFHSQPIISSQYVLTIPSLESFMASSILTITICLSLQGIFLMISNHGSKRSKFIAISAIGILAIAFVSDFVKIDIITERWFYVGITLLSIPLGISIFRLIRSNNGRSRLYKNIMMSIILFSLVIISISYSGANPDNRTIFPNLTVQKALTMTDIYAFHFTTSFWDGRIGGDRYYINNYMGAYNNKTVLSDDKIYNNEFSNFSGIFLIRAEILNEPFHLYSGIYKLDYNLRESLEKSSFNLIYTSDTVYAYRSTF